MAPQLAVTAAAGTEFFCSPKRREMQKVGNAKGKAHQEKGLSMSPQVLGMMSHWQVSLAQGAYGDVQVTQAPESSPARCCSAVGLLHLPHLHGLGWSGKDGGHLQTHCWECIQCPPVSAQATHSSTAHTPQRRLPAGCRMKDVGCRVQNEECRVQGAG